MKNSNQIKNLFHGDFDFSKPHHIEAACIIHNLCFINDEALHKYFSALKYNLGFLIIKTINPPLPKYKNCRPYQHIPFYFSMITEYEDCSAHEQTDFMGVPEFDPRGELLERLIEACRPLNTILVFEMDLINIRLNELKEYAPAHQSSIESIQSKLMDLKEPFQKRWYFDPQMIRATDLNSLLHIMDVNDYYSDVQLPPTTTFTQSYLNLSNINDPHQRKEERDDLAATGYGYAFRLYCLYHLLAWQFFGNRDL